MLNAQCSMLNAQYSTQYSTMTILQLYYAVLSDASWRHGPCFSRENVQNHGSRAVHKSQVELMRIINITCMYIYIYI